MPVSLSDEETYKACCLLQWLRPTRLPSNAHSDDYGKYQLPAELVIRANKILPDTQHGIIITTTSYSANGRYSCRRKQRSQAGTSYTKTVIEQCYITYGKSLWYFSRS